MKCAAVAFAIAACALAQQSESITTTSVPQAVINRNYSVTLAASPGTAPVWSLAQGTLPAGLTLSAGGVISGIPNTLGESVFLVRASDPNYGVAYQALELDVVLGPLNISNTALPIATQNAAYSATFEGSGGVPPYQWSFASTVTLGLTLNASNGVLSGTPASAGAFGIPVTITDSIGENFTRAYTLQVAAPLSVLTTSLPNGAPGVAYSQALTAGGGQAPYSWSASGLPAALQIDPSTGRISGVPAANGTSQVNVQVTDYGQRMASRTLALTVGPGVVITNTYLAFGAVNTAYSQTLTAAGGVPPYVWSLGAGGSLPPGLSLNTATGVISGTPADASSLTFSVKVTDSVGDTGFGTFTINILAPLRMGGPNPLPVSVGAKISHDFSASGGQPPYRWSAANLPAGLNLDASSGTLSGAMATAGSSTFALRVADALGHSLTDGITVIAQATAIPAITIGGLPSSPGYDQQPEITVSLASPYTSDLTGTLSLTFASSVGGADGMIQFGPGGNAAAFTIPAGTTQAQFSGTSYVKVLTGTVAGTITLTVSSVMAGTTDVTPSPPPTATITTQPTVPFLSSITYSQTSGGVTVTVNGFSSALNMTSGTFQFAGSPNATLSATTFTVSLSAPFNTWYSSSAAGQYGSEFTLNVPFAVQGQAADLIAVTVTLTNSKGGSTSCASPIGTTTTCSSSSQ